MQVKRLVKHGNSVAIIIDKALLQAANLDEKALFQIITDPSSGIVIQSVKPTDEDQFKDSLNKVLKKHDKLFKNLADR
jgi:antitoxin component of MazEF toxin-antitoxin module